MHRTTVDQRVYFEGRYGIIPRHTIVQKMGHGYVVKNDDLVAGFAGRARAARAHCWVDPRKVEVAPEHAVSR